MPCFSSNYPTSLILSFLIQQKASRNTLALIGLLRSLVRENISVHFRRLADTEHSQRVEMVTTHQSPSVTEDLQIHKRIRQGSASVGIPWGGRTRRLQTLHFTLPSWGRCFAGVPVHTHPSLFQPILRMGTRWLSEPGPPTAEWPSRGSGMDT